MQLTTIKEPKKSTISEIIIGIDFGTTNSLVSVFKDGKYTVIPQEDGSVILPSIIGVKDGEVIIGKDAKKCKNYISSIKTLIARKISPQQPYSNNKEEENVSNSIACEAQDSHISDKEGANDDCALSIGYASKIFSSLKDSAEKYLGCPVNTAVVTVPAYFDNASRTAIKDAATIAGLNVARLLSEPTAAALFYGVDEKKEKGTYIVYDLGGGTFDISILEFHRGIFKVSCSDGDDHLGGDNFDHTLVEHLTRRHNFILSEEEKITLLELCMEIKEELSQKDRAIRYFNYGGKSCCLDVTLEEFEKIIKKYIERTITILKSTLRVANLPIDKIDGVLLVGGSTRIPMINKKIVELFGQEKVITGINPETIVARGAALMGSFLSGKNPEKIVLLDILPLSLGVETLDGTTEKIIMKDSPIPMKQSQVLTNALEGQTSFKIRVLQGERELAKDNRYLAEFTLSDLPSLPVGKARIEITFSVDEDGILEVSATELLTGKVQTIEVNPHYGLKKETIEKMVKDSFINLKEDIAKRSLIEAKKHAERVLCVLKRALKKHIDLLTRDEKVKITESMKIVERSLQKDDSSDIRRKLEELEKISDPFLKRGLDFLCKQMKIDLNI